MIKIGYNKKSFLLIGLVAFLVIVLTATVAFVLSRRSFDERIRAVSEIGMSLSPNSGAISTGGLDIDLIINTHGESISGVDITLQYSGDIDYVSFSQGDINNCSVVDVRQGLDKVNLHCFIDPAQPTYTGSGTIFATVKFNATNDGSAQIEITEVYFSVREAVGEVSFLGGSGQYTTSLLEGDVVGDEELAMELNPSSGNITSKGTDINLVIDTQDEDVSGIDVTLEYLGEIDYVSFSQGEISDCNVFETKQSARVINLHCFIDATKPTYRGTGDVFATVNFKAIADGEAEIEVTNVDFSVRDSRNEISFLGGFGNYTSILEVVEPPRCGTLDKQTFPYGTQTWPSTSFCLEGESSPSTPTFPNFGSTTNWRCVNEESDSVSCSATRESPPPPRCGTLDKQIFTHTTQSWPTGTFCSEGTANPLSPTFPALGSSTNWGCVSLDNTSVSCTASRESAPAPLPETSIFDSVGILGGTALLLFSGIAFMYKGTPQGKRFEMRQKLV